MWHVGIVSHVRSMKSVPAWRGVAADVDTSAVAETTADEANGDRGQQKQEAEEKTREKQCFHGAPYWLVAGVLLVLRGVNEPT